MILSLFISGKKSGHRRWLEEVYDRFHGDLLRYTRSVLGEEQKAREVVQETFLKLWKAETPPDHSHLQQWLLAVCRNGALDVLRKEKKLVFHDKEATVPDPAPDAAGMMEKGQEQSLALRLLAALPADQREVIRLKFQHGCSYKQISAVTGHSESNVGYLIHTGIKTMRSKAGKNSLKKKEA